MLSDDPTRLAAARALCSYIDSAPSPFHAAERAADRLVAAGFERVGPTSPDSPPGTGGGTIPGPGRHVVVRGGSLVAWSAPLRSRPSAFRIVGAHTDSPNLRIKPRPDATKAGFRQLGVEVYGGVLLNSWLDRDLGLSGRVVLDDATILSLNMDRPLLRIPQLAIHLDRDVNDKGLVLNRQTNLAPFWALDSEGSESLVDVVAVELGCAAGEIVAWELMTHPVEAARLTGLREEFVSAPRIDNLLSCWAATEALARSASDQGEGDDTITVAVLFDHEEVGSASARGADGVFLASILERVAAACGVDRTDFLELAERSWCVSADCAHATNPNYADRHEPSHQIALNGGPVIKANANLRYATDAETAARFASACRSADVPLQWFVNRTDLACGSTIGPLTAAALGIRTVDVGAPQLAMHSARELCGSADPAYLADALTAFFAGA